MPDLPTYQFPARPTAGLLLGLSAARLGAVAAAGVVLITTLTRPTPTGVLVGLPGIVVLLASAAIRVGGRALIDWLPVGLAFGWQQATRNNEFYATPELDVGLPDGTLDLPGELFGIEIHHFNGASRATVANPTPAAFGIVRDTFRHRMVAIAEIAGEDFLFLDPADQQARIAAWGRVLDHVAQSLPELSRLQVLPTVGPASTAALAAHHRGHGCRGTERTAGSYRQVLGISGACSQQHRVLLAIGLDVRAARRAIRQAGGGTDGAARVLMDRAAVMEETLRSAGLAVQGWLPAPVIGSVLRAAFDPAAAHRLADVSADVNDGGGVAPAAAGPTGMADGWAAVRHDSGWSVTLQIVRPPSRPVTGDFLQHLLIGVPAQRRLSLLYVPTPLATAERRAQTQQVSTESEQTLRARWGFGTSARQRRAWQDAAQREADLVEGRTVYWVVWLLTVTAATTGDLDAAVGQVEAAARRCSLELRRLSGTQRQAFAFTLPLCRGAR
ncbi:MAG TPA: SCO6880 family protein [Euzebya sp.]|nr:SCO6880 family protein [Euzebya sp.]